MQLGKLEILTLRQAFNAYFRNIGVATTNHALKRSDLSNCHVNCVGFQLNFLEFCPGLIWQPNEKLVNRLMETQKNTFKLSVRSWGKPDIKQGPDFKWNLSGEAFLRIWKFNFVNLFSHLMACLSPALPPPSSVSIEIGRYLDVELDTSKIHRRDLLYTRSVELLMQESKFRTRQHKQSFVKNDGS